MSLKKSSKKKPIVTFDSKKESVFKELSTFVERFGYQVRRERLKQGHGWRVLSGTCRAGDTKIIFVERRLSQSDQIAFLLTRISSIDKGLLKSNINDLSEEVRNLIPLDDHEEANLMMAS